MARSSNSLALRTQPNILKTYHILCFAKIADSDAVPKTIFLDFKNLFSFSFKAMAKTKYLCVNQTYQEVL